MNKQYKDVEEMLECFIESIKNGVVPFSLTEIEGLEKECDRVKEELPICW